MARTRRIKKTATGVAYYHLMSRTNDRRFLFDRGRVKTQLVDALKRAAAFSGVEIDAYVAMDNHFHVVCKVVRPEAPVPEDELIRRVAALKGGRAAEELASHWRELREMGMDSAVAEFQNRLRARMNDISEFMKTFKETFDLRGQVCIASRGKVEKLCMDADDGIGADVFIRALRGSGGLWSP